MYDHRRIKNQFYDMLNNVKMFKKTSFWQYIIPFLQKMTTYLQIGIKQLLSTKKNLDLKKLAKIFVDHLRYLELSRETKFEHFRKIK